LAAVQPKRAEGIGRGELLQAGTLQPAPPPQLAYVGERVGGKVVAHGDEVLHVVLAHSVDLAQPETQSKTFLPPLRRGRVGEGVRSKCRLPNGTPTRRRTLCSDTLPLAGGGINRFERAVP